MEGSCHQQIPLLLLDSSARCQTSDAVQNDRRQKRSLSDIHRGDCDSNSKAQLFSLKERVLASVRVWQNFLFVLTNLIQDFRSFLLKFM